MKKQLLTVLLTSCLTFVLLSGPALAAEPGGLWTDGLTAAADSAFSGGDGSQATPYLLSSATDLAQLALNVNSKTNYYTGVYFLLTKNISLGGKYWVPIGNATDAKYAFRGFFDGGSHVISSAVIKSSEHGGPNKQLGFFGWVYGGNNSGGNGQGACVKNLALSDASLTTDALVSGQNAGLLVGYADRGVTVENCCVSGGITATVNVDSLGGLIGRNYAGGNVENCCFIGSIDALGGTRAAGLLACRDGGGTPTNCYSAASIVSAASYRYAVADTAANCYYDSTILGMTPTGGQGCARTTAQLRTPAAAYQLDSTGSVWRYDAERNGGDPHLVSFYDAPTAFNYAAPEPITVNGATAAVAPPETVTAAFEAGDTASQTLDFIFTMPAQDVCDLALTHTDDIPLWTDGLTAAADSAFSGGDGSQVTPYLILSAADLAQLAANVNAGSQYAGKYFKLTQNIDLAGKYWMPIGNGDGATNNRISFRGQFDGDNHTISDMTILMSACGNNNHCYGLFGWCYGGGASIKNTGLTNASMTFDAATGVNESAGMFMGYADCGVTIDNCFAQGTITATAWVNLIGGLVGHAYNGSSVNNCYFSGSINAQGGTLVGGLIGYTRTNSAAKNCYAAATITSDAPNRYAVASAATNCYYDSTILGMTPYPLTVSGVTAKTTAELQTADAAAALGAAFGYDALKNDGYPYLYRSFMGEDYSYNIPAPVTVNGVTATVTSLAPGSPQKATVPVAAAVTLTGTMEKAGIHSVSLQSASGGIATAAQQLIFVTKEDFAAQILTLPSTFQPRILLI